MVSFFSIVIVLYIVLVAYITSAIWHGFYPGYYIFFIHIGFIHQLSKNFYKLSLKYPNLPIYDNIVYKMIRLLF